jgi:hypothetical protein
MTMQAAELLRHMASQYAAFTSYRDTGYVLSTFSENGVVYRMSLSTLYQQPNHFRFTFFRPHPHPPLAHIVTEHTIGFDGTEGYALKKGPKDIRAIKTVMPLRQGIAGATGISSGSAHTIGRLLLRDVGGVSVLDLRNPHFNSPTNRDGADCYSISTELPKGGERELWIEKDTLCLRKVVGFGESVRSEEVRENIHVNESLPNHLFVA